MTQAYINSLKPRPHFEDVVFGKKQNTQLVYPERAYIMRDSLYYGIEDKEKLQNEERAKMMESNLKLIGQEVNMTLPQMRELMKDMFVGQKLTDNLKQALSNHREAKVKEQALKARDEQMASMLEKVDKQNALKMRKMVSDSLGEIKQDTINKKDIENLMNITPFSNARERIRGMKGIGDLEKRSQAIRQREAEMTLDPEPSSSSSSSRQVEKAPRGRPLVDAPQVAKKTKAKAKAQSFSGGAAESVKMKPRKGSNK